MEDFTRDVKIPQGLVQMKKKAKKYVSSREARKQALGWNIWTNLIISNLRA
jgi:hypothetical protein